MSQIASGASFVIGALLQVVGAFFDSLVQWLVTSVVEPLLRATLFAPTALTAAGCPRGDASCHVVASAFQTAWHVMAGASVGVALLMMLWGALRIHLGALSSGSVDKASVTEGVVTWAAVLVGGQFFFTTMLQVANRITLHLYSMSEGLARNFTATASSGAHQATAVLSGAAAIGAYLFWPTALLILTLLLVWVMVVWIWRQVELVFFTCLVPVLAAISIGGNKQAFAWGWSEAVGALFSQLAMSVAFYIAFLFIGQNLVPPGGLPTAGPSFGTVLVKLILGAFALGMVAKAPSILKNVTGHQHAGIGAIAGGVMAGTLMARGAQTALRMSPGGAALHRMSESRQARAEQQAASWSDLPTVGQRLAPVAQALGGTRAGTSLKGVVAGVGSAAAKADAKAHSVPLLGWVYGGIARPAAGIAVRTARTAASYAIQPRTTLGRNLVGSYGAKGLAEAEIGPMGSRRLRAEAEAFTKAAGGDEDAGKRQAAMLHRAVQPNKKTGEMEFEYVFQQRLNEFKYGKRAGKGV